MTRWDVCNAHLAHFQTPRFVEIGAAGVCEGRGGRKVKAVAKWGVDPHGGNWQAEYTASFVATSDQFFAQLGQKLNAHVILIDGLHEHAQVLRDVEHSLEHLHPLGLIVVHDCNPPDEVSQLVPRPVGRMFWNGDCWKAIVQLRATRSDLSVYTLDTDTGLGLIRRAEDPHVLIDVPPELTWAGLVENRQWWLGLCPP